ncbi:MAG: hypothetical protein ABFR47_08645 [Verrucomicrobiota bacterium]
MTAKTSSILIATLLATVFYANASTETDYLDDQLAQIQAEFNVQVHYRYDANLFFPPEWHLQNLALSASEIEIGEATRMIAVIRQFLAAHPASVIHTELEHIYLLKELNFGGKSYGGTHQKKSMYITCNGIENGYVDDFMLCRLQSEFSSILFENHSFPTNNWILLNPQGFTYSGSGFEVLGNPCLYDYSDHLRAEGFLLIYSQSSLENDFNMISSWLFTKKGELDAVSQQHAKIQQKQDLVEQFYKSLNAQYNF